jgi:hypothetical protein
VEKIRAELGVKDGIFSRQRVKVILALVFLYKTHRSGTSDPVSTFWKEAG